MPRTDEKFPLFKSGLLQCADGLRTAITNAPDNTTRADLEQLEAGVRRQIRAHRLPSPESDRIWWGRDWGTRR